MNRYLILGDSHLVALLDAARELGTARQVPAEDGLFSVHEFVLEAQQAHLVFMMPLAGAPSLVMKYDREGFSMSPAYASQLRAALALLGPGPVTICSVFFGNEHSAFSIADHPVPFDFLRTPDDVPCPAPVPRQIVPLAVIERKMADLAWRPEVYCRVLKLAFAGQRVLHVLPPPPIEDEAQVKGDPEIFGPLFERYPVAPALLRLKVYSVYCRVVEERLRAVGVDIIGAPAAACDNGYLARPYWREATHANGPYGTLILQALGVL